MDVPLLEELQSKFKCTQCGKCCVVGGDMFLFRDDVLRIASDLNHDFDGFVDCYLERVPADPDYFLVRDVMPCAFLDKLHMRCQIQSCKPLACRDYPFVLYARGECNIDAILTCPVAVKMLEDHLKGAE